MYNILVSGASGIVGYGILRCLKDENCRTIGTTIYEQSPAECFSDVVEIVPRTTDEGYIKRILEIISKHKIDMLIPGIEADMVAWNDNREIFSDTGAVVLLNRKELIDLCLDKWSFYKVLCENKINCRIESAIDVDCAQFEVPFILKPRRGYGSKGVVKIENRDQINGYVERIGKDLMIQEYVGNDSEEYTVSAFFDESSHINAMIAMKRKLAMEGYTEVAETVDEEQFLEVVTELAHLFGPVGPTNFQFRKHCGEWKLLEINPRISSATSLRKAFGYNESRMAIEYFLDRKESMCSEIRRGKGIRYIEDYIVYDSVNI